MAVQTQAALRCDDTYGMLLIWSTVSQLFAQHAPAMHRCYTLITHSPSIGGDTVFDCEMVGEKDDTILRVELHETSDLITGLFLINQGCKDSVLHAHCVMPKGIRSHNLKEHFQITGTTCFCLSNYTFVKAEYISWENRTCS